MADEHDSGGIKELREAAERGRKAAQELDDMKREMAFLRAGVDTDSKAGQLLYKAYDGELDTDLLRLEAEELGILKDGSNQFSGSDQTDLSDERATEERQALSNSHVPPEDTTENPYDQGHRQFKEMMDAGRPKEDAAAAFVSTVIEAAGRGDQRVISDR
jgi:hypothetical protein|tara:strand:+ start:807 stop:1286 length:480 start_codon:yes stop_codon:yes gene_type:complete